MLAQIHLGLAGVSTEPEHNTQHHTRASQAAGYGHAAGTSVCARDTPGLPHLQASTHAVPSASSALPLLYLANLWSVFTAQLRSPILRRLPHLPVKYSQGPQDFPLMTLFGFSTSSFLCACILSAFPRRLKTQQAARNPCLLSRYPLQAVDPRKHMLTAL